MNFIIVEGFKEFKTNNREAEVREGLLFDNEVHGKLLSVDVNEDSQGRNKIRISLMHTPWGYDEVLRKAVKKLDLVGAKVVDEKHLGLNVDNY